MEIIIIGRILIYFNTNEIVVKNALLEIHIVRTPVQKLNIGQKLVKIALLSLFGIITSLVLFYHGLSLSLMKEKEIQLRQLSNAGYSIIEYFHSRVSESDLSITVAQNNVKKILEATTFGENGYFWINDSTALLLMHPYTPELVETNLYNTTDIKGNYMFRNMVKIAKDGGGFTNYYWPKPRTTESFPKNSYVVYFEPWDWVLGTGLFLDDMKREIRNYAISALGVVFIFSIFLILFSISLTRRILHQLEQIAISDPLTNLHTRRYLNESMDDFIQKHRRYKNKILAVIFFDIDHFKNINDNFGHSCGDEVLSSIGGVIKKISRPDDLCVRYGGEEFVVILLSDTKDVATQLAKRIRLKSNEIVFNHNKEQYSITLSAGIAYHKEDESFEETLQRADKKMYMAKSKGRNCIVS